MMRNYKTKKCSLGFTIIESAIAMFLLGIMMVGGIAFYTLATKHSNESAHQKLALELADSQMEFVRSSAFAGLTNSTTNATIGFLSSPATVTTTVTNVSPYKQIDVDVTWQEPERPGVSTQRDVHLQTYVAP